MKPRIPKGLLTTLVWFEDVPMEQLRSAFGKGSRWDSQIPDHIIVEYVKQHHQHRAATYLQERDVIRYTLEKPSVEGRP